MKTYDLTQLGGFPLTQNRLKYMQEAYQELATVIGMVAGDVSAPLAITGAVVTSVNTGGSMYDYAWTAGWIMYNGELIRVPAGTLTGVNRSVDDVYFRLVRTSTALAFYSGSTPNVENDVTATLVALTISTVDDASNFLASELIDDGFKAPAWVFLNDDATSPARYRRAFGSKRVLMKGVTYDGSPTSVSIDTPIFTLPVGYRPAEPQLLVTINSGGALSAIRVLPTGVVSIAGDVVTQTTSGISMNISFDLG